MTDKSQLSTPQRKLLVGRIPPSPPCKTSSYANGPSDRSSDFSFREAGSSKSATARAVVRSIDGHWRLVL